MSEVELNTAQQSGTLETNAEVLTPDEAQPAAADQETETTQPPEEPPVTAEKRALSAKKLAANRANAQLSAGGPY